MRGHPGAYYAGHNGPNRHRDRVSAHVRVADVAWQIDDPYHADRPSDQLADKHDSDIFYNSPAGALHELVIIRRKDAKRRWSISNISLDGMPTC